MSAAHHVEAVVIGAGVVGLACARSLAMVGKEVLILERESIIGSGTSSRNSEVVHSGLYYPCGSWKARCCVRGRALLYAYCGRRDVATRKTGKLLVATSPSQVTHELAALHDAGRRNGVEGLRPLSRDDVLALEPALEGAHGALLSPETGIVDSHGLMVALLSDAARHGAMLALQSTVERVVRRHDRSDGNDNDKGNLTVVTDDGTTLSCELLVNSAGLRADVIAAQLLTSPTDDPATTTRQRHYYAKGNYYRLEGQKTPFSHLVYPVPSQAGLGVHATVDLAGNCRFGPDVEWVDHQHCHGDDHYTVDPARADSFYDEIRKYWPALQDGALAPDYAGIRPKLGHPAVPGSDLKADFRIEGPTTHGVEGFVNLMGIESPGLTSSMAIAEHVRDLLGCSA